MCDVACDADVDVDVCVMAAFAVDMRVVCICSSCAYSGILYAAAVDCMLVTCCR